MTTRNHQSLEQFGGTYSITTTVLGWKHVFIKKKYLDYIIDSFHFFQNHRDVYTVAYCIMPNHIHSDVKLIESYAFLRQKLDCIHHNPIQDKWKIVEDLSKYQYSSCNYYTNGVDWNELRIANLF